MRLIVVATFLVMLAVVTQAQKDKPCPVQGSSSLKRIQALDRLKNRTKLPQKGDFDSKVTLKAMLKPGKDTNRWKVASAATIIGFVRLVKPGEAETVNCEATNLANRDTHIELVLKEGDGERRAVVVEVTPRLRAIMQKRGEDWSSAALEKRLKGRVVTVQGWLFLDEEHTNAAENTNPRGAHNWRGTAWEIHPITSIQVAPSK